MRTALNTSNEERSLAVCVDTQLLLLRTSIIASHRTSASSDRHNSKIFIRVYFRVGIYENVHNVCSYEIISTEPSFVVLWYLLTFFPYIRVCVCVVVASPLQHSASSVSIFSNCFQHRASRKKAHQLFGTIAHTRASALVPQWYLYFAIYAFWRTKQHLVILLIAVVQLQIN